MSNLRKKHLAAAAGLMVIIAVIAWFFLFGGKNENNGINACGSLEQEISAQIGKMNSCQSATDCVLINGCPYGCNRLINKDADWSDLLALTREYKAKCGECDRQCPGGLG